jgi:hypothetical protein
MRVGCVKWVGVGLADVTHLTDLTHLTHLPQPSTAW